MYKSWLSVLSSSPPTQVSVLRNFMIHTKLYSYGFNICPSRDITVSINSLLYISTMLLFELKVRSFFCSDRTFSETCVRYFCSITFGSRLKHSKQRDRWILLFLLKSSDELISFLRPYSSQSPTTVYTEHPIIWEHFHFVNVCFSVWNLSIHMALCVIWIKRALFSSTGSFLSNRYFLSNRFFSLSLGDSSGLFNSRKSPGWGWGCLSATAAAAFFLSWARAAAAFIGS